MIARQHNHYNGPDADDPIYPKDILDPEYFRFAFNCDPPVPASDEDDSSEEEEDEEEESTGDSEQSPLSPKGDEEAAVEESAVETPASEEKTPTPGSSAVPPTGSSAIPASEEPVNPSATGEQKDATPQTPKDPAEGSDPPAKRPKRGKAPGGTPEAGSTTRRSKRSKK